MSLTPGTRIGPYEVLSLLGAGGMGEVYRARDTQLNRDVALKILPAFFARDLDRLMRFEREAQTLASLNHPQIAQIYGIEQTRSDEGAAPVFSRAIVMEFVEGEDLSKRTARGPMPLDEVLPIARQIADALAAAHDAGIIHRDLKPANIKVRPDGTVKVLDFGLAKGLGIEDRGSEAGAHATITSPAMTMQGVILGTAAYMAPEQAKGKTVDKRADIWAFGCVLYEMLAGRRAFPGDDVSDTLAFVLMRETNMALLPARTPLPLERLLRRCLQKDVKNRFRDIGDVRLLLDEIDAEEARSETTQQPARWRTVAPWAIASVALAVAISALVAMMNASPTRLAPVTRFMLPPPPDGSSESWPVLSPDATYLVYAADRLYMHALSEFEPRPLPGTEGASRPFISPDGRWVGYYADGKMKKLPLAGGNPQVITDVAAESPGAWWADNGRIYFSAAWNEAPLLSISPDGGAIATVTTLDRATGERGHWWPRPLPDGRHMLFTIWPSGAGLAEARVGVVDLQTGRHRALFVGARPQYTNGALIYFADGVYQIVDFDVATLTVKGHPTPVLSDALGLAPQGTAVMPLSVAPNGTFSYLAGQLYPERRITWIGRDGKEMPTRLQVGIDGEANLSPDGKYLALGRPQGGVSQIWVYDLTGPEERRFDFPGLNWSPLWHPDGSRLAFTSMRRADLDIVVKALDSVRGDLEITDPLDEVPIDWLADGSSLIAKRWESDGATSLLVIDTATGKRTPLVTGPFQKGGARVSPDGRWLAVCANSTGTWGISVRPLSGAGTLQQVAPSSPSCEFNMRWSRTTRELFYPQSDEQLASLQYDVRGGRFAVVGSQPIRAVPRGAALYGVSPDGQRLLVGVRVGDQTQRAGRIHVVINGVDSLRARAQ